MSNPRVIIAFPDTFTPVGNAASQVVAGLQVALDRKRAALLDESADNLEKLANGNRALARRLRERHG
jgi:hypothetical protein